MKRPIFSRTERRALARFLRKAIGVALIGLGLALTLALFSYDPTDAAVFSAHWKSPNNWLGAPGAVAADILMRIFGVAGYGAAVLTLMWGARIYWRRWISSPLKRVAIAPIALFAAAMFASAHAVSAPGGGGLGGLLGDFGFGVLAEGLPFESAKIRLVVATLIALALAGPALLFAFGADWAALAALHRTARSRTQEAFALLGQRIDVRGGAAAGALFAGAVGVAAARSFRGRPGRTETEPLQRLEPRFEFDEPSAAVSDPIADDESATVPQPPLAAEGRPSAPKWERTRIFPWVSRGGERGPRRAPSEPPLAAAPSAPRGDLVTLANRFRETAPDPIVEPGFADTPKPTTGEVALPEWLAASASDEPPLTNQKASTQQPLSEIDPHQDHEPDDWDAPADPSPEPRAAPIAAIPSAVLSIRDYAEERRRTAAATVYEVGPNARLDADSLESAAEAVAPTTMRRAV
ncbi:MAG: DNA translocase FtsK 4TM domain-containing protein, partial [Pseudomonadota bacterium]